MTDEVIVSLDQVTTEWLTGVLSNSDALTNGSVAAFDLAADQGNWSTSASLNLRYGAGSQGALPQRLFLKMVYADLDDEFFGPSVRPIYIIDRQPFDWSLTTWLGVYDLAYAMVLDWEVETRRRLEMPILRHYHDWLSKNGVNGYPWEQLVDDYRLSVAMGVYIATEYCRGGINERWTWSWLPMLQRSLTACDDLDCNELW